MKKCLVTLTLAALSFIASAATNLVSEGKRQFDVPFKGEGKMGLVHIPVFFPQGTKGATISCEVTCRDVVKGSKSWFDARIMTDFINSECKKVKGGPVVGHWAGTRENVAVKKTIPVPEGAAGIALMPCLFNVKSGAMSVKNLSVVAHDSYTEDPADKARRLAYEKKKGEGLANRQAKAAARLAKDGSLIPPQANGELYVNLVSTQPGRLVNSYKEYDLPAGTRALKFSWEWKVSNLKCGKKPWFDARILFKFKDAGGRDVKPEPGPSYVQRNIDWQARETSFLVPEKAVRLVIMPCLFQVAKGELQMRAAKLVPTGTEELLKQKAERERQIAARYVPDEPEKRANWPKEVKVVGNRLRDAAGNEVWLQGVNIGGMETVPNPDQVVKSAVVAMDEWKSNCLRLPVNETLWFGKSPYQNDGGVGYRAGVDKIVRLAANRGAYVVIDLHRFRAPKKEHIDFWKVVAKVYANHPAVLFDLFNEPHGIDWKTWRDGGFVGEAGKHDESAFLSAEEKRKNMGFDSVGMQALVNAVRSTGAKNVVIAGGLFWANDLTGIANDKGKPTYELSDPTGNGVMYAWHTYHWHKGWNRMLPVLAKYPVFLGEVGASPLGVMNFIPDNQQEDPYTFSPDMLAFIQKYRINWTGWCFHPKAAPCILKNWDYEPTPYWGEFVRRALGGEKFTLKRMR